MNSKSLFFLIMLFVSLVATTATYLYHTAPSEAQLETVNNVQLKCEYLLFSETLFITISKPGGALVFQHGVCPSFNPQQDEVTAFTHRGKLWGLHINTHPVIKYERVRVTPIFIAMFILLGAIPVFALMSLYAPIQQRLAAEQTKVLIASLLIGWPIAAVWIYFTGGSPVAMGAAGGIGAITVMTLQQRLTRHLATRRRKD